MHREFLGVLLNKIFYPVNAIHRYFLCYEYIVVQFLILSITFRYLASIEFTVSQSLATFFMPVFDFQGTILAMYTITP